MRRLRVDLTGARLEERRPQRRTAPEPFCRDVVLGTTELQNLAEQSTRLGQGDRGILPPDVGAGEPIRLCRTIHEKTIARLAAARLPIAGADRAPPSIDLDVLGSRASSSRSSRSYSYADPDSESVAGPASRGQRREFPRLCRGSSIAVAAAGRATGHGIAQNAIRVAAPAFLTGQAAGAALGVAVRGDADFGFGPAAIRARTLLFGGAGMPLVARLTTHAVATRSDVGLALMRDGDSPPARYSQAENQCIPRENSGLSEARRRDDLLRERRIP